MGYCYIIIQNKTAVDVIVAMTGSAVLVTDDELVAGIHLLTMVTEDTEVYGLLSFYGSMYLQSCGTRLL